jgi:hypothetical protein
MNVTGGSVVANAINFIVGGGGGQAGTAGTLNLTNATLVVSNGVTIGAATTLGTTLSSISSTIKLLNSGSVGTPVPLTTLNLDGGTLQIDADGNASTVRITATTINTNNPTTINIHTITNVTTTPVQIPLISYTGNDPFPNLVLGTYPAGYTVSLVDNTGVSVDAMISAISAPSTNASILKVSHVGTNIVIHGTNNNGGNTFHYAVLSSTNLTLPLSNWTPLVTNPFNADGTFDYTNPIVPAQPRQFLEVQVVP